MRMHYPLTVIFACLLLVITCQSARAQNIAINNTGFNPAASAMLDIQSSDRGLLIPQISLNSITDAATITNPAHSLLVYNTNAALADGKGYYYNSGTGGAVVWVKLAVTGSFWKPAGNAGTIPGNDFVGTTDAKGLMFKTNNIQSGYIDLTGTQNTSFGVQSLLAGGGLNNVAFGWNALKINSIGNSNVAIGSNSLVRNKEGQNNIAIGSDALRFDSVGNKNISVGGSSLYNNLGDYNTAIGHMVMYNNNTGLYNIALGNRAGYYNTTGSYQFFLNSIDRVNYAGDTTASPVYIQQNAIVALQRIKLNGQLILPNLPAGAGSKALRIDAGGNITTADTVVAATNATWNLTGNTATSAATNFIGTTDAAGFMGKVNNVQSLYIDYQHGNTSLGQSSLLANTTGNKNVAVGDSALRSNTSGISNTAVGNEALFSSTTTFGATAIGYAALRANTTGSANTAIGRASASATTTGASNVAVGVLSLTTNTIGNSNTALGTQSLMSNTSGGGNVAVGQSSLAGNTSGLNNIGLGYAAGSWNNVDSNRLFINSQSTYSYADDTTKSILYGVMNSVTSTQRLRLNARIFAPVISAGAGDKAVRWNSTTREFTVADTTASTAFGNIAVPLSNSKPGEAGNQPAWGKLKDNGAGSRGVYAFSFAAGSEQEVFFTVELPHNWKEGTAINPLVHFAPQTAAQSGNIEWGIEYSWVNYDATSPLAFPNTAIITAISAPVDGTTNLNQHLVTPFASVIPNNTQNKIGSVLMCRFFRKGGDVSDTYNGNAAVLSVDFHYEIDGIGSRTEYVK